MSWGKGIRRDKYDELFSYLVRERADFTCEYCNRSFRHDPHGLHCSHLFGRRAQSVRLHPENAFAHCIACHRELSENPVDFAEWAKGKMGDQRYHAIWYQANKPTKFTVYDREIIHKHYLSEKKRMLALRKTGATGRIEFTMVEVKAA